MRLREVVSVASLSFVLFFLPLRAAALEDTLIVAVAANALRPVSEIVLAFEETSAVVVKIVHGSTGKLYAQITQGAPFDIFLSADRLRPLLLIEKGFAKPDSGFTYVRGALALWTDRADLKLGDRGLEILYDESVKKIAIANPVTAPYGRAALDVVLGGYTSKSGKRVDIEKKLVYGESVSQAFSYVRTGNAQVAITALSTIYSQPGEFLVIDESLYELIVQDGVILKDASHHADAFKEFLFTREAIDIFIKYGYRAGGTDGE